jgi:S-adenosylmethionine synthetase
MTEPAEFKASRTTTCKIDLFQWIRNIQKNFTQNDTKLAINYAPIFDNEKVIVKSRYMFKQNIQTFFQTQINVSHVDIGLLGGNAKRTCR